MLRRVVFRAEDHFQQVVGRGLRVLGRPVQMLAYPGYGVDGRLRVLGRAVVVPGPLDPQVRDPSTWQVLSANLGRFVTSEVPFATAEVECEGQRWTVTTDREGYVDEVLDARLPVGRHLVTITPLDPPGLGASGVAHVHPPEVATAVVSDIDDTVIDSGIARGLIATVSTALLHDPAARVPLDGAPLLYRALAEGAPTGERPFFYLSTSPWNLAGFLGDFLDRHGFPGGPLLLTDWGPSSSGLFRIGGREHKLGALRRLAGELPSASFVLLGDSGQQDAQIYTDFAVAFPGRVAAVYIRRSPGASSSRRRQELVRSVRRLGDAGVPCLVADDSAAMLRHAQDLGLASR